MALWLFFIRPSGFSLTYQPVTVLLKLNFILFFVCYRHKARTIKCINNINNKSTKQVNNSTTFWCPSLNSKCMDSFSYNSNNSNNNNNSYNCSMKEFINISLTYFQPLSSHVSKDSLRDHSQMSDVINECSLMVG